MNDKDTDDMAPTQVLLTTKSPLKGTSATNKIISDKEDITEIDNDIPTQIINITTKKEVSSSSNDECLNSLNPLELGTVDDYSIDNTDYEMAPTQPINDIVNQKSIVATTNKTTDVSIKSTVLNTTDLDDTIERNLNAIFEDVNEERIEEHSQISTQVLENMLQSSECEDKLSNKNINSDTSSDNKIKKSVKGRKSRTLIVDSNVINKISRKSNIKNNNDSQNTDNFDTTSTQKQNVSIDSRDPDPTVNTSNSMEKEKTTVGTRSSMNYNNSSVSVTLSRSILADSSTPKSVPKNSSTPKSISKTLSTPKSVPADSSTPKSIPIFDEILSTPKSVPKSPSMSKLFKKNKHDKSDIAEVQKETEISEKDKNELAECSSNIDNQAPTTPINEQLQQPTKVLDNDDEDILAGLPEVRISGTLSNPASPTSSISSEYTININHNRRRQIPIKIAPKKRKASRKSSRKTFTRKNLENTECHTDNKPSFTTTSPNFINSLENNFDVDKESVHDNSKKDKKSKQSTKKVTTTNERKKSNTLPQAQSIPLTDLQEKIGQSPLILNCRRTRNSTKENIDRSSVFQVGKEALIENEAAEPAKGIKLNISRIGKRSLSMTDAIEDKPKKRKENINEDATVNTNNRKKNAAIANSRYSANTSNIIMEENSPINMNGSSIKKLFGQEASLDKQAVIKVVRMPVCTPPGSISSMSSSTPTELMIENSNNNKIRQSQRKASIDSQVVTNISNNENKKTTRPIGTRRNSNRKMINKFESHVDNISSYVGEESQEIEMIMNGMLKNENIGPNTEKKKNVGKNTKSTKTKNTKGRRNTNICTDIDDTESSSASSILYESDNARFEIPIIKLKQAKISKSSSNKTNTTVNESIKETKGNTKQSSRLTRSRQQSVTDSSVEESTETVNQTVSENTTSKTNNLRNKRQRQKTEKVESNKKQKKDLAEKTSSETNSSIDTESILSTPNRTRRSVTFSLTTSSPFKIKHKILFTGISNNNYNKLLTKLGMYYILQKNYVSNCSCI